MTENKEVEQPYYLCYGCEWYVDDCVCEAYWGMTFDMFKRKRKCLHYEPWY